MCTVSTTHHPCIHLHSQSSLRLHSTHVCRQAIFWRKRTKPARPIVPYLMMDDKTSRPHFLSPSRCVDSANQCAIILTHSNPCYSMHTPSVTSLPSLKITGNIPHVTRSTDFSHSLSIAFVLYYSSLYHPAPVDRLVRYVWFVGSVCP